MKDGLVCLERVRDWDALECQRHICEIQGYEPHIRSKVPFEPLRTPLPAQQFGAPCEIQGYEPTARSKVSRPLQSSVVETGRYRVSRAANPDHLRCPRVLSLREASLDTRTVHCLGHWLYGHREVCHTVGCKEISGC